MSNSENIVVLGFGPQPINFLNKALKLCGDSAELAPDVARMAGANIAVGTPASLAQLRDNLTAGSIKKERERHGQSNLSENAIMWLATGQRGLSSETLFTFLTGVDAEGDHGHSYPHDPDDLRRCRLMLEQCPELVSCLPRVAAAGPVWAALVARWEEVCALMDEETPDWRKGHGRASKTYDLMKTIITGAQRAQ